jgi:hypothetical protein
VPDLGVLNAQLFDWRSVRRGGIRGNALSDLGGDH